MKQNFWLIILSASLLLAGAVYQNLGLGERGIIVSSAKPDILVRTSFEPGDAALELKNGER